MHKESVAEFEILAGVEQALKDIIIEAVESNYLPEIEDKTLVFLGGALDFTDTKTLLAERDQEWDASEVPMLYFNQVEKAMKQLTQAGIQLHLKAQSDMALYFLKNSGEFDAAVREWESKPTALKTWANIKTFISTGHSKANKQNKLTTKQFRAKRWKNKLKLLKNLSPN
jgi:hypothetical protein